MVVESFFRSNFCDHGWRHYAPGLDEWHADMCFLWTDACLEALNELPEQFANGFGDIGSVAAVGVRAINDGSDSPHACGVWLPYEKRACQG